MMSVDPWARWMIVPETIRLCGAENGIHREDTKLGKL